MVIIALGLYPTESAEEMSKRFLKQPPLPAGITVKGPYFNNEVGKGSMFISIYEFDQSKFAEAQEAIGTRFARYFGVPGFTFSMNPWAEAKEALKMMGKG